nr:MAG TPA: hypothetical protein [Caudoviricetes sp.]
MGNILHFIQINIFYQLYHAEGRFSTFQFGNMQFNDSIFFYR